MATPDAPRTAPSKSRAAFVLKAVIGVAVVFVLVAGLAPRLQGADSVSFQQGHIILSIAGIPVEPTTQLDLSRVGDDGPSTNLFPLKDTSDGSRDAATGKGPIEYTFAAPEMYLLAPTFVDHLYSEGPPILGSLIVLAMLALLWRMVGTLNREVFTRANARRMVAIGLLIGLGLSAVSLLSYLGHVGIVDRSAAAGKLSVPFGFSFVPLLTGAVIVVFAEVFRRGVAMREDLETVV